jgi:hypothetical protein
MVASCILNTKTRSARLDLGCAWVVCWLDEECVMGGQGGRRSEPADARLAVITTHVVLCWC